MKKFFLLVVSLFFAANLFAQTSIKYQGEVDLGYSFGVGTFATDRVNLNTIQGLKFGDYFSAGIGFGIDYFYEFYGDGKLFTPLYLNLKGYLPISLPVWEKSSLFVSFDIGSNRATVDGTAVSGLFYTPAIGAKIGMIKFQFGYNMQKLSGGGVSGIDVNSIQLRVGAMF